MRNILTIFRNDLKSLYKHFFALLIILAICILPALYAWFNIYAFWDPYGKTGDVKIAVVSDDKDYMDADGKKVNMGKDLVAELKDDENFGYVFLDDADKAINGVYDGSYYAAVVIEPDFTYNMYNFLTTDMDKPTITFYQNEKRNAIAVKVVEASADNVKQSVNEKYIEAIVSTLFDKLNTFSQDVQGNSSVDMLKNTLIKIKNNLGSYSTTVDCFISANNQLIDTLNETNNTVGYSIHLIGNERVNISKHIAYIEDSQEDLSLINTEINNMLLGLQDSIDEALYKLDRLYDGNIDDAEAAKTALIELERQYQELIDYLTRSGLSGPEVEDALTSLNEVTEKITELREKLGLNNPNASTKQINVLAKLSKKDIKAVETDYEEVVVPSVFEASTGYEYDELTKPNGSAQSMDTMMEYMVEDTNARIDNIQDNLKTARTTKSSSIREAALQEAKLDADIVDQEMSALDAAFDAINSTTGSTTSNSVSGTVDSASKDAKSASDILDDILSGDRDINLNNDLKHVGNTLNTVRVALTETVYPAMDTMLDNLQNSLGDVSSLLLDLSDILGKTNPIISELGNTFGAVNNALIQVKDLISSYTNRISDFIDILEGGEDDDLIQSVLDFFNIDPATIGFFLAKPVDIVDKTVYPVESYGVAMTPFYTMLAIWVGCVIINSILRSEASIELIGATDTQKFFGRYLLFFIISLMQTMIIMIGDLVLLGVDCLHPGLFLLTGVVTSLTCSMLAYGFAVAFGTIGKFIIVVIMIIQIAGSGGSYPIELLPGFFQQIYLFFPFPYAINAMREAIAGLYQNAYLIYMLQLLIFFAVGAVIGIFARRPLREINHYMNEQLEKTEMM